MVSIKSILDFLKRHFSHLISDYSPNGLQVEGKEHISNIRTAVTASLSVVDKVASEGAELLLVHHGYFWRNDELPITGMHAKRISTLLANGINLVAYHLPLDIHKQWGNNCQLAKKLQITGAKSISEDGLIWGGKPSEHNFDVFCQQLDRVLETNSTIVKVHDQISNIAWCTGAGQSFIQQAAKLGYDCFLTGEASEKSYHEAKELGINFISAGHHATERYGIQKVGEVLAKEFGLEHKFIDENNPF